MACETGTSRRNPLRRAFAVHEDVEPMLPARSLPFELVHEDELQISQRKAVHRRLGIFMGLVEGHRDSGSIRRTPVCTKVAMGTWFHQGDQDLPWKAGSELHRVPLPSRAVHPGCAPTHTL